MKLMYRILIAIGILLLVYLGGFIHGRYSVEKHATKYTRQITSELVVSEEANRIVQENDRAIKDRLKLVTNEIAESRELVNGNGNTLEELGEGFTITIAVIEECIGFVEFIGEIYSETEEE